MGVVSLQHLKSLALKAKAQIAEVASTAVAAIEEVEELKADKTQEATATIATSGWGADDETYPNFYDIAVAGVTAADEARVMLAPASVKTAVNCGMCPTCETLAGKIRIRTAQVPSSAISVKYRVEKGKE